MDSTAPPATSHAHQFTYEELSSTLESVTDGFIRFDRNWRIVYANAEAERINRMSRAEMLGNCLWELFPALRGSVLEREFHRAVSEHVTVEFENRYDPFGGWYALKGYPTPDGGLTTFIRDITAQKAQQEALAASEAQFRELADAMPQIVYSNNADGVVDFANRQWFEYTGQAAAKTADLGPVVHPDDLAQITLKWQAAQAAAEPYVAEFRLRHGATGEYRWFLTRCVPVVDEQGTIRKWFGTSTDIHEKKRTEQQLIESEARTRAIAAESERLRRLYETVLANTPDFVYVFSLDHRVLYANDALIAMWGRGVEGAIGKTFLEIGYEPWHAAMHDREIDEVRATRRPIRGEVPFNGTQGRRQYEYIFVPIIGADGEVEAVAGTTRDITDRLQSEERLRASEELQSFLVTLADTIRPLSDPIAVQEAACRTLGQRVRASRVTYFEMHGDEFTVARDYVDGIPHLAGRFPISAFGPRLLADYQAGRTAVEADVLELPWLSPAEKDAYVSIQARSYVGVPLVKDGAFVAGLAVHSDRPRAWTTTEVDLIEETAERTWAAVERVRAEAALRESEERFRTLFSTMDEGFCVIAVEFDAEGRGVDYRIELMNAAFEQHTGMGGLAGRSVREAIPTLEEFWFETYGRVAGTGRPARFVHQVSAMEGRWFDVSAFRIGGEGSTRVAVLFNDISPRKRAEADRERLVSQLRDLDRRKDEFLATLAHELRNPLAPIRNGLQVIGLSNTDATVEWARAMMERQLGHLIRLVDDLLDVSRVTTGKLELRREHVDLGAVLAAEVETLRPQVDVAGLTLSLEVPAEPLYVDGDPIRLAQVVSNLLTNACKYTRRGGAIRVALTRLGDSLVLSVTDNGIGIPSTMLESVFELFTQVDRTLEKTTGGLGIGLSLARGLVEMHGGMIEARSDGEHRGTVVEVRLPAASDQLRVPTPPRGALAEDAPRRPRRILVIDDNIDAADSLGQLLEMLGHEVRTAYDGEAGMVAARLFHPHVVLCDIGMPKVNGYDAARRLRDEPWGRTALLVALTGWGQQDARQRSAEAGFDLHLVKPVESATLAQLLATAPFVGDEVLFRPEKS